MVMGGVGLVETRGVTVRDTLVTVDAILTQCQNEVVLTGTQYRALNYIAGHAGRFVTERELGDELFGPARNESAVRQVVRRLRQRLGVAFIETGPDGGYRISQGRADSLTRECGRCRRPIVEYGESWTCFACGATGEGPKPIESAVELEVGRAPYREGSRSGKPWSDEETAFAVEHNEDMSFEEIGEALQRSEASVRGLYQQLGLRKRYVRRAG